MREGNMVHTQYYYQDNGWFWNVTSLTYVRELSLWLCTAGYGVLAAIALVQLIRIQRRVPEYGWTTQKVFHLCNLLVCSFRCGVFIVRNHVNHLEKAVTRAILFDLPGLLFATTYSLLVLFWAEIYNQARGKPTRALRPTFLAVNALVYAAQIGIWIYMATSQHPKLGEANNLSGWFMAAVSVAAAAAFLAYGGRLFLMLQRFPVESRGRRKKLREVGTVTAICTVCFTTRAVLLALSNIEGAKMTLDVADHALLDLAYYFGSEILPMALVLYILRKLPPKRADMRKYQPVRTRPHVMPPTRPSDLTASQFSERSAGDLSGGGGGGEFSARAAPMPLLRNEGSERVPLLIKGGDGQGGEEEEEEGAEYGSEVDTEGEEEEGPSLPKTARRGEGAA